MAFKTFEEPELGTVTIYKRRGSRSLRLTVQPDGNLRVTIPTWAPYASGLTFARSRSEWIREHTPETVGHLEHGQIIGKAHRLMFTTDLASSKVATRITSSLILVKMPPGSGIDKAIVQSAARNACIRALRRQAEDILPERLHALADTYGFKFRSVNVRQLKSRWGSCDQHQNITLNLFLMTLPWDLIDYVLLHELTHTKVMQHGPVFWNAMKQVVPDVQARRKALKAHRPIF